MLKSVGSALKKGWRKMKQGASKMNHQIKESKVQISESCLCLVWKEDCGEVGGGESQRLHPQGEGGSEAGWKRDQERGQEGDGANQEFDKAAGRYRDRGRSECHRLLFLFQTASVKEVVVKPVSFRRAHLHRLEANLHIILRESQQPCLFETVRREMREQWPMPSTCKHSADSRTRCLRMGVNVVSMA